MKNPENILLVRLKSIGDVVFTLPAVNAVRANFPEAKITFLTSKENAPLLRGFREVNEIIPLDRAAFGGGNRFRLLPEFLSLLRQLRAGRFSLVVDFQGYGETAWLSWWTGAPERWGNIYGPGREWLYTHGVRRDEKIHLAECNLSLLRQCGLNIGGIRNEFALPEDALAKARAFFAENNLQTAGPTLFFQPFTSSSSKNWPLPNYLALAKHFQARGAQIIFGGGPADRAALAPARGAGFVISAGVPLLVSAGLAKLSTLTVGGDTGLLHVAVAMNKRVVMLMTVKARTHPIQHADWIVTRANEMGVAGIPMAEALAATEQAFSELTGNAFY